MVQDDQCPAADAILSARRLRPRLLFQGIYRLKQHGILWCIYALGRILRQPRQQSTAPAAKSDGEKSLNLQLGGWVRVKAKDQIRMTLDARGRHKGLLFTPQMYTFCGRTFHVHQRVERMYLEESRQVRRLTNTVLLKEVFCDGRDVGCDRGAVGKTDRGSQGTESLGTG